MGARLETPQAQVKPTEMETPEGSPYLSATGARDARVEQEWGVLALAPEGGVSALLGKAQLRHRDLIDDRPGARQY